MITQGVRKRLLVACLAVGVFGSCATSHASLQLGSFKNPPNGQDNPLAAVIAAITAAGGDATGLEFLYKNDGVETGATTAFSVDLDGSTFGNATTGSVTQSASPVSYMGMDWQPAYVTVKPGNQGFIVFPWPAGGSEAEFDNDFYQFVDSNPVDGLDDTTNAAAMTYTYNTNVTNGWASPSTGTLATSRGISHISVWGRKVLDPNEEPEIPEPVSLAVWSCLAAIGVGTTRRRRS